MADYWKPTHADMHVEWRRWMSHHHDHRHYPLNLHLLPPLRGYRDPGEIPVKETYYLMTVDRLNLGGVIHYIGWVDAHDPVLLSVSYLEGIPPRAPALPQWSDTDLWVPDDARALWNVDLDDGVFRSAGWAPR